MILIQKRNRQQTNNRYMISLDLLIFDGIQKNRLNANRTRIPRRNLYLSKFLTCQISFYLWLMRNVFLFVFFFYLPVLLRKSICGRSLHEEDNASAGAP